MKPIVMLILALAAAVLINPVLIWVSAIFDAACAGVALYALLQMRSKAGGAHVAPIGLAMFCMTLMSIISTPIYMTSAIIDGVFAIATFTVAIPLIQAANKAS